MISTLDLAHSAWPSALRLVADAVDQTLATEAGAMIFNADPGLQFGTFQFAETLD